MRVLDCDERHITGRKKLEATLQQAHDALEQQVAERTAELVAVINSSGLKLRLVDELKKPFMGGSIGRKTLEAVERDHILQTLDQAHWKIGGKNSAAEILGLDRSTLRARMRKLGI